MDKKLLIIKYCRKSLLYHIKKKSLFWWNNGQLQMTGVCKLAGTLVLVNSIPKGISGLYMDDSDLKFWFWILTILILMWNVNWQNTDRIIKYIIKRFKMVGFKIEIETKLKSVDFLDTTFNLFTGTYKPYRKSNDNLLYVHSSSNHLLQINTQLLISTAERFPKINQAKNF